MNRSAANALLDPEPAMDRGSAPASQPGRHLRLGRAWLMRRQGQQLLPAWRR